MLLALHNICMFFTFEMSIILRIYLNKRKQKCALKPGFKQHLSVDRQPTYDVSGDTFCKYGKQQFVSTSYIRTSL